MAGRDLPEGRGAPAGPAARALLAAGIAVVFSTCVAAAPAPVGGEVEIVAETFEQFDACTRDGNIDVHTRPGCVMLAPSELLLHDVGYRISKLSFGPALVGRKVFHLERLGATKAELYVFGGAGKATFNGAPLAFRPVPGTGWSVAAVRGQQLREGTNEVLFLRGFNLAQDLDRSPPHYSFVRKPPAGAWRPAAGEFMVHLRLFRHPARGVITSQVLDLANPQDKDIICPLLAVDAVQVESEGDIPPGTSVTLQARTGPTPQPDAEWTDWMPPDGLRPARYVQWRAVLRTDDRARTPVLKRVVVRGRVREIARADNLRLVRFENQRIVRPSRPYRFQRPSPKLSRLREMFHLDRIVADGQDDLERLVLLRNWVRRQWPHNEGNCTRPWDAMDILTAPEGDHGMCVHYAVAFTQCALALGYNARQVILDHHYVADVWSNEHRKWVLMDVECVQKEGWDRYGTALYVDSRTGEPLSALELHRALRRALVEGRQQLDEVTQLIYMTDDAGRHRQYTRRYGPQAYVNFRRFAYTPRNDYLDHLEPWEVAHGVDYYHCDAYLWWKDDARPICPEYSLHTSREGDLYWTVNLVRITLTATEREDTLSVILDTVTPNLEGYLVRFDDGEWKLLHGEGQDPDSRRAAFAWRLRPGLNTLQVKPRNAFGRDGVTSSVAVEL